MQNRIVNLLLSPFLFCLIMGVLGIFAALNGLGKDIQNYAYLLGLAFILGLVIGLGVFALEQSLYNPRQRKHNERSSPRGAWLWKAVFLFFLSIVLLLDKVWKLPVEVTHLVVFSGSIYLLTLSCVFFRLRNHPLFSFS